MNPFEYPLPESALAEFCHPDPSHLFSHAVRQGRDILAANGHLAIRCHRGAWIDHEFPEATDEYIARFQGLPWSLFKRLPENEWKHLADVKHHLFRFAPIKPWLRSGRKWGMAPCPIWRVGTASPVRLSLLQLIARLPAVEVWGGELGSNDPLYFRFSGGIGLIAANPNLREPTFSIFQARLCPLTRERLSTAKPSTFRGWGTKTVAEVQAEEAALEAREFIQD